MSKFLVLVLVLSVLLTSGGVFASWMYAETSPLGVAQDVDLGLSVFEYPPRGNSTRW